MKISIIGIGYVGAVAAACHANDGHEVIALDLDPVKVTCINEGRNPIVEKDLGDYIKRGKEAGRLRATDDYKDAILNSDITMICVGTPSNEDGSLKLDYVEKAARQIGEILKDKDDFHAVVIRSTVVPGTAMDVVKPALEEASGKQAGVDFGFGNNPEFLRESTAIWDYYNPPKIVIGALDGRTASMVSELYKGIEAPEVITDIPVAEGVKYADNAWHAAKVAFANELGNALKDVGGLDSHEVMKIFFKDTKLNISTHYLLPGFAFGGSCLPKDVRALRASAQAKGLKTPVFDALLVANEEQVVRAHKMIAESGKKVIGMLGLSFKAGTDDLRESPLVTLADRLLKDGYELIIYDPNVWTARETEGANQKYIREGIPHISQCLVETPEEILKSAELFVIGNGNKDFGTILGQANDNTPIIDLVRLRTDGLEERGGYQGICW